MKTESFQKGLVVVTENIEGHTYLIQAQDVQDIINDWNLECIYVPQNDARVFFASWNGIPISPYEYTDFESLLIYLKNLIQKIEDTKKVSSIFYE